MNHKKFFTRRLPIIIIFTLLMISVSGTVSAQSDSKVFVIGEITSIPGGFTPPVDATSEELPTATPTVAPAAAPAVRIPSFSTNGQRGSRQSSFRDTMAELGYVEGQNVTYIFDPEAVTPDTMLAAVQSMVDAKVDLIVAYGTAASVTAKTATEGTDIPVVFVGPVDPVQLGIVKTLQNTEGNVTGVGGVSEAYTKQLEWLMQIVPNLETIYLPYPNLSNPATAAPIAAILDFAAKSNITVIEAELPTPEDITAAIENLPDVDAIMMVPFSPGQFIQASVDAKIPLSYAFPNAMDLGVLLSYNYTEQGIGISAAHYADRILKGAKPSNLPVEIAANALAINLYVADMMGITIPDEILIQADIIVR